MSEQAKWSKSMKSEYTLVAPQMSPIHFDLIEQVFRDAGFKIKIIKNVTKAAVDYGLKLVNNDMCYPAIMSIGQVVDAAVNFRDEDGNPSNKVAIVMTQTGGGCRASNYYPAILKALKDEGRMDIPVIPLAFTPGGDQAWNQLGLKIVDVKRALYAILLGDLLMTLLYKTRPYEVLRGESDNIVDGFVRKFCEAGFKNMDDQEFKKSSKQIVQAFSRIMVSHESKPKIGFVGEILLKYHYDANNHLVHLIEREDCEAVTTPLIDFFLYCLSGPVFQHELLDRAKIKSEIVKPLIDFVEKRKAIVNEIFKEHDFSKKLHWSTVYELSDKVDGIITKANSMGEGWLLPAEIIELTEQGCPHIVIAQPFACLPNHTIGQGTVAPIANRFPESNVLSINFDPGASEANQINRIKLLASNARKYHQKTITTKTPES